MTSGRKRAVLLGLTGLLLLSLIASAGLLLRDGVHLQSCECPTCWSVREIRLLLERLGLSLALLGCAFLSWLCRGLLTGVGLGRTRRQESLVQRKTRMND